MRFLLRILGLIRLIIFSPLAMIGLLIMVIGLALFSVMGYCAGIVTKRDIVDDDDECADLGCEDCEHKEVCLDERVDAE